MSIPDKLEREALQKVLRYLGIRARSRWEVEQYLQKKLIHHPQQQVAVSRIMTQIEQFNLLNDYEFARQWAKSQLNKSKGPVLIKGQLKQKGIASQIIKEVIAEIDFKELIETARQYLDKISYKIDKKKDKKSKKYYIVTTLQRRGFEFSTINALID